MKNLFKKYYKIITWTFKKCFGWKKSKLHKSIRVFVYIWNLCKTKNVKTSKNQIILNQIVYKAYFKSLFLKLSYKKVLNYFFRIYYEFNFLKLKKKLKSVVVKSS